MFSSANKNLLLPDHRHFPAQILQEDAFDAGLGLPVQAAEILNRHLFLREELRQYARGQRQSDFLRITHELILHFKPMIAHDEFSG